MPVDPRPLDLEAVRAFAADELTSAAAESSLGVSFPRAVFERAGALGVLGIEVPAVIGGSGAGFALKTAVARILAAVDFGFSMSVINTHNVAARLSMSGSSRLQALHVPGLLSGAVQACTALTEPDTGSDVTAMQTRAVPDGDDWVLTGEKSWIINARRAGLAIVYAHAESQPGAEETIGRDRIAAFLVDLVAPGVRRYPIESAFSQSSLGTGGFVLDGVRVPADAMLLPAGGAFKAILGEINGARAYVAAMCCGMLAAAHDEAAAYGRTRRTFGVDLFAHQDWRLRLAGIATDLAATEALTARAITDVAAGRDAQLTAAQAKVHAVQTAQKHLPTLLHAMGAEGLKPDRCLARHNGAVQIAALTDGSTAMLLERVAVLIDRQGSDTGSDTSQS